MQKESVFQRKLILELKKEFPGAVIFKNDARYIQGFPDWTILNGPNWAVLEVKRCENAPHRPNQDYYVDMLDEMSYAAFVYPENERKVLDDLQRALRLDREARVSQS